jgi:hypothetical protein
MPSGGFGAGDGLEADLDPEARLAVDQCQKRVLAQSSHNSVTQCGDCRRTRGSRHEPDLTHCVTATQLTDLDVLLSLLVEAGRQKPAPDDEIHRVRKLSLPHQSVALGDSEPVDRSTGRYQSFLVGDAEMFAEQVGQLCLFCAPHRDSDQILGELRLSFE